MKIYKKRFEATMVFDDESIRKMFRMESRMYERARRLTQLVLSMTLIIMSLFAQLPTAATVLCLMFGSFMVFAGNFRSDIQAERVLQSRRGALSRVRCTFSDDRVNVSGGPSYKIDEIERLARDDEYYYIFWNRQTAVMVPREGLEPAQPENFESFLSKSSGRQWQRPKSLLLLNWRDLVQMFRDKAFPWIGR